MGNVVRSCSLLCFAHSVHTCGVHMVTLRVGGEGVEDVAHKGQFDANHLLVLGVQVLG